MYLPLQMAPCIDTQILLGDCSAIYSSCVNIPFLKRCCENMSIKPTHWVNLVSVRMRGLVKSRLKEVDTLNRVLLDRRIFYLY